MRAAPPVTTVADLVAGAVSTIEPTATLREAAEQLAADGLGLLVVVGPRGPRGVLSERDVVAALAEGGDPDVERVGDRASDQPVEVARTTGLHEAARAMLAAEVRHLVLTDRGDPTGVVSVRDVLGALLAERG